METILILTSSRTECGTCKDGNCLKRNKATPEPIDSSFSAEKGNVEATTTTTNRRPLSCGDITSSCASWLPQPQSAQVVTENPSSGNMYLILEASLHNATLQSCNHPAVLSECHFGHHLSQSRFEKDDPKTWWLQVEKCLGKCLLLTEVRIRLLWWWRGCEVLFDKQELFDTNTTFFSTAVFILSVVSKALGFQLELKRIVKKLVVCFQEDSICLSCTTTATGLDGGDRVCLAAEGFGNRMCFLQSMSKKVSGTNGPWMWDIQKKSLQLQHAQRRTFLGAKSWAQDFQLFWNTPPNRGIAFSDDWLWLGPISFVGLLSFFHFRAPWLSSVCGRVDALVRQQDGIENLKPQPAMSLWHWHFQVPALTGTVIT